ncbi:MAG: nucleotide exchange factor GrpE [candidate division Zixibacteria bacterium]|nr:nucleotide exchange factor GrpE [candidate division Zixibacteria bacterium]
MSEDKLHPDETAEKKAEIEIEDGDSEVKAEDSESSNQETDAAPVEEEPRESESERYMRLAAEFDNYKKRTAREFGDIIKRANFRLLQSLVEIADNFERAIESKEDGNNIEGYKKGVELIYSQLAELLKKENISSIEAVGKAFDPNLHEAMMQQESDEYDEGIVIMDVQKGYQLDDKVLRHARVIVSSGKKKSEDENKSE